MGKDGLSKLNKPKGKLRKKVIWGLQSVLLLIPDKKMLQPSILKQTFYLVCNISTLFSSLIIKIKIVEM